MFDACQLSHLSACLGCGDYVEENDVVPCPGQYDALVARARDDGRSYIRQPVLETRLIATGLLTDPDGRRSSSTW